MTYRIQGTLKLPDGAPAANCEIEFVSRRNFSPLVQGAKTNIMTSATGAYDVTLELGEYAVIVYTGDTYPAQAGTITLSADTTPGLDLPSLLNRSDWVPATPEYMQQIEAWLVSAGEYAASAESSAQSAAESAESTSGAISAHEAKTGAHSIAGVSGLQDALNGKEDAGAAASLISAHKTELDAHAIEKITGLRGELDSTSDSLDYLRNGLSAADGAKLIGACPDIATARTLSGLQTGQRVNVVGYYASTQLIGGGTFIADAADTTTADNGGMTLVTADGVRLKRWLGFSGFAGVISAAWFGCVGDGVTDNTTMSQAALTYATSNGYHLSYPAGVFYHAGQVTKPQSFTAPNIYGAGANNQSSKSTVLWFDSAIGIKIKGGSGNLARSAIYNCVIRGKSDQTTIPLQFADICGFDAIKCRFENAAFAANFHNESSGGFTEFCRLVDCEITSSCLQALLYSRASGNNSFHGSGIDGNTVINEPLGATGSPIQINSGCITYNAPLSFTIFKRTNIPVVQNNSEHLKTNFYGNVRYERANSAASSPALMAGDGAVLIGGVSAFTEGLTLGTIKLGQQISVNSDGTTTASIFRYSRLQTISSGDVLSDVYPANDDCYEVKLTLSASNYEYVYVLHVYRNRTDYDGSVVIVSTPRAFNSAGYGAPTLTFTTRRGLTVTNANYPASTVVARYTVTQLGMRQTNPLLQ